MDDFDRDLKRLRRFHTIVSCLIPVFFLIGLIVVGVILSFIGWVIVELMGHFGVI